MVNRRFNGNDGEKIRRVELCHGKMWIGFECHGRR